MRTISRSAIVPYADKAMYQLVADISAYPQFLPWCIGAEIISESEDAVVATLVLSQGPLTGKFTTRNLLGYPTGISMQLVDGPFSELEGSWRFSALGDAGCKVDLEMQFAFANPLKDQLLGAAFEQTCGRLVDAFVKRAADVYS